MSQSDSNHYTFGDTALAADRLRLLAEAFADSSRRFLSSLGDVTDGRVVDLGSGPGYTTELLADTLRPAEIIGLEKSAAFVALARSRCRTDLRFVEHDVTHIPFPVSDTDLLYVRFLVTHLHEPASVLARWAEAARPGGRLAIEEMAALRSDDDVFTEYYGMVERLQARYGQNLYIGAELPGLLPEAWTIERYQRIEVPIEAPIMARLHAMNVRTWRGDAFVRDRYSAAAIDRLTAALDAVADRLRTSPPVVCTLAQMVVRRGDVMPSGTQ